MTPREALELELASRVVTVLGLPFAVWVFMARQRKARKDFHAALPQLLRGEDPQFRGHILRLAQEERAAAGTGG